jgi:hypothetical protein
MFCSMAISSVSSMFISHKSVAERTFGEVNVTIMRCIPELQFPRGWIILDDGIVVTSRR